MPNVQTMVKLVLATSLSTAAAVAHAEDYGRSHNVLFTITNEANMNAVIRLPVREDGSLGTPTYYETRGKGTGASLSSQGAITLSSDGRWLFAVDAGSNDIAVFSVHHEGLQAHGTYPSGGTMPVSVTSYEDRVYVLNAGGNGNIAGFELARDGSLAPIPGSTQLLSSASAGAAQIQASADGKSLVVTEKATSNIDVYQLNAQGVPQPAVVTPSSGSTPYGFALLQNGTLIVSEAPGSALSSYDIAATGKLNTLTASETDGQKAACWVAASERDGIAFTANAASSTISGYSIDKNGKLRLLPALTSVTGTPLDLAFSPDSKHLYAITHEATSASLVAFDIDSEGNLTMQGTPAVNLPATTVGVAVQ